MQTLFICLPISLNFISSCVIDHTAILENLKLGRSNCRSHFQLSCSILFSFSNACPQIDLFVPGNGFSVATQNLTTWGCVVCPGSLNDVAHKRTKGIYGHSAIHIGRPYIDISWCYIYGLHSIYCTSTDIFHCGTVKNIWEGKEAQIYHILLKSKCILLQQKLPVFIYAMTNETTAYLCSIWNATHRYNTEKYQYMVFQYESLNVRKFLLSSVLNVQFQQFKGK